MDEEEIITEIIKENDLDLEGMCPQTDRAQHDGRMKIHPKT